MAAFADTGPVSSRSTWAVLTITGLGAFIAALDQTVVVTVLPSVMLDLKIPITELDRVSWIITAYLLGYTVAMPLLGRLGDVYGYPRVYQASLVVFCIGTSLVALSQSFEFMIGARVIQAIGGGATVPLGMALAVSLVPADKRALALGVVGGAAEAGSMLGPAYGGAIVELSNWRWIFWLNVPQSAIVFVALMRLPNRRVAGRKGRLPWGRAADCRPAAVVAGPFPEGPVHLAISGALHPSGRRAGAGGGAVGGGAAGVAAVAGRRIPAFAGLHPSQRGPGAGGVSLILAMVTVPLAADTVMQKDPFTGAMWLLRMTGIIPLASVLGGWLCSASMRPARSPALRWAQRLGEEKTLTVAGLLMVAAGLFLCSRWEIGVDDPELTLQLLLAGGGFGLVIAPVLHRALQSVDEDYRATAASLVTVSRMMGMTLGLAAMSAWGVEHFQVLTSRVGTALAPGRRVGGCSHARVEQYTQDINTAGLSVFRAFFRTAALAALSAIPFALLWGRGNVSR